MTLVRNYEKYEFTALSTDIVNNKIEGLKTIGAKVYITDTKELKIVDYNLNLSNYIPTISTISIGTILKNPMNLITIDDTINGTTIVEKNPNRLSVLIHNQGVVPILISFGEENTSINNYNLVVAGGSDFRYGDGGSFYTNTWRGKIKGFTESSSTIISILEETIQ